MKGKNIIPYILLIVALIMLSTGIALNSLSKEENTSDPKPSEDNIPTLEPTPTSDTIQTEKEFFDWQKSKEEELTNILLNYLKEFYSLDYEWPILYQMDDGTSAYFVSLKDLKQEHGVDTSAFHTKEVSCDDEKVYGRITVYEDHLDYSVSGLICDYHVYDDPNTMTEE